MGKFDGVLLCTDFDHTLAIKARVSPENAEAIRYFKENGGRFTVVSGRNPLFLQEMQDVLCVNAPLVGYNGARILDPETGKFLYEGGRNDHRILEFLRPFWESDTRFRELWPHNHMRKIPVCKRDREPSSIDALLLTTPPPLYNTICVSAPEDSLSVRDDLRRAAGSDFVISRSWSQGTEVICPGDEKGDAVLRLKEYCRARLLVTVGDYENDISMLRAGDIGYAVANATDEVKAAADRVTVDCADHAIAAVILELEREL